MQLDIQVSMSGWSSGLEIRESRDKSGPEATGTGWGHGGRMFRLMKEPRPGPRALQTTEGERRRKNSPGTWEEAAWKVRHPSRVCPDVRRRKCCKTQGRDQCVRVLPEGHLSQTSDPVTDQLLAYEGGFFLKRWSSLRLGLTIKSKRLSWGSRWTMALENETLANCPSPVGNGGRRR